MNMKDWSKGYDFGYVRGLERAIAVLTKEHKRLYKRLVKAGGKKREVGPQSSATE